MGKRKSFVGTPCWMAPEVITGKQYDASADIWSFGITALELTQGRAPLSRSAPSAVLTQVATAPPPKMERNGGVHTYSAAFADIVAQCLQKDPSKRPTAQELLASGFFKGAKKKGYLVGTVLKGLPPLAQRQEKRRVPSMMTHATMESWDFSLRGEDVPVSPTTSVYSRRARGSLPKEERVLELDDEDLEVRVHGARQWAEPAHDEDAAAYAQRVRERHRAGSRSHSRSVSFVDLGDAAEPAHHVHSDTIAEVDVLSSSPRSVDGLPAPSVPDTSYLSASLPPSSPATPNACSSSSSSTNTSEAVTPPQSVAPPPPPPLWRRLIGHTKMQSSDQGGWGGGGREKERDDEEVASVRRKALGGKGILAGRGVGMMRAGNGK